MRLIDADANIETMKKCAANPENEQALLCYRFAQRILEEAPTVEPASPWHRVEEEPIEYQRCMVYSSETGQMVSGVWTEFGWMIPGPIGKLTHWMPIEPPKEDV